MDEINEIIYREKLFKLSVKCIEFFYIYHYYTIL